VRLLDAAVASGLMSVACARRNLPAITSWSWTGAEKPDDDFALAVNGEFISDNRNNLGMRYTPIYNEARAQRYPGDVLEVFTFDGWPAAWNHVTWSLRIIFSTGETDLIDGGETSGLIDSSIEAPSPIPSGYFERPPKITDHYRNGHGSFPLPKSWPWPKFLGDKIEKYQFAEYTTSRPQKLTNLPPP
jgi:hypothetical protein